jgi:hypothetical protein
MRDRILFDSLVLTKSFAGSFRLGVKLIFLPKYSLDPKSIEKIFTTLGYAVRLTSKAFGASPS